MQVGVVRESAPGERRVAVAPDTVGRLEKLGFTVAVERGAGVLAGFDDAAYEQAGARVVSREEAWGSDVVLKIDPPRVNGEVDEVGLLKPGALFVSLLDPARNGALLDRLAAAGVTAIALDRIPRITRAQKMDVLSSMANIAGYRAVIEAAHAYGSFFTPQMTAAGKSPPARVLVIGAGVAGLAAIGAARSLGAEVRAFDVRAACREQVESMGARFLEVDLETDDSGETEGGYAKEMTPEFIAAEMALFAAQAAEVDIIITTALIPGKPAPRLITEEMVASMKPGSVIVDLAAATGGNCAGTVPGEITRVGGVTIIGLTDLPSRMARVASRFFGSNLAHLLDELGGTARLEGDEGPVDLEDEVFHQSTVVLQGAVRWPIEPFPKKPAPATPPAAAQAAPGPAATPAPAPTSS
ncbi:MAG: Re/Si-specific NAD(P)(+) transhydrogenase subunit alpha, partial [Deltaproteobacteria bacterium]